MSFRADGGDGGGKGQHICNPVSKGGGDCGENDGDEVGA